MRAFILPIVLILRCISATASAQEPGTPAAVGKVEIKDTKKPNEAVGFITIRVNGALINIVNARPKDVIETLFPAVPIVGVEHLPSGRRYEVTGVTFARNYNEILTKLGEKLGLSITEAEATADFLIVRNLRNPVPPSWTPAQNAAQGSVASAPHKTGIGEVDKVDHLYNAYDVGMIPFVNFVTDRTTRPVWDQTSLTGAYSFSFKLPKDADVMKLLFDMGFDVFVAKRTTQCIVIAPGDSKK